MYLLLIKHTSSNTYCWSCRRNNNGRW